MTTETNRETVVVKGIEIAFEAKPAVSSAAGTRTPGRDGYIWVANTVVRAVGEAAVVMTNTAENTL